MNLMNSAIRMAVIEGAKLVLRPDIAQLIESAPSFGEDHDFRGAPRTKAWVETHNQPTCSPHADFINGLVEWACELERALKKEG